MGISNLFRKRNSFQYGGGADMGGVDAPDRDGDGRPDRGGNKDLADKAAKDAAETNAFNAGLNNNNNTTNTTTTTEEEKPTSFLNNVFDFFSDLAPTPQEEFEREWDKMHGWQKKKALSQLGITENQLTGDVMSAFNDYNSMSLKEIQDAFSGLSLSGLANSFNPLESGTLGMAMSMFDAMNPFTNTQHQLQDMNNWSMEPSDLMGPNLGTYTGNIPSLNSAQLADLSNMQGGLTNTQLGQALAGMVNDAETHNATRGPTTPRAVMDDQNVEITEAEKQIADLVSRGFSEAMAERMVSSGKYFASYDE